MDDPWGSPWADEIQHFVNETQEKDDGEGIEVSSKTRVNASTLGLEEKPNTLWDDDNGSFGEWAAISVVEQGRGNEIGHAGAVDAWAPPDVGNSRDDEKGELNGPLPSWNDHTPMNDGVIPKLAPTLIPQAANVSRQPSPDPWATETTLNDEKEIEHAPRLEEHTGMEGVGDRKKKMELLGSVSETLAINNAGSLAATLPESAGVGDNTNTTDESTLEKSSPGGHDVVQESAQATGEAVSSHDTGHESSRPSSSPSEQSHHEEILPESPRTSLDEDPKRPQGTRKVSAKIQELVEHFDGLSKQDEDIAIDPNQSRSRLDTPPTMTEEAPGETGINVKEEGDAPEEVDDDDFGDFEDGQSEVEDSIEEEELKPPATPTSVQRQFATSPSSKIATPQESPPHSRFVKKNYGRVEFLVGKSTLDKFYSQSSGEITNEVPVENVFIMDTIPYDSFQSLEERKTWYRISRYGSMKKHNSGDGENYIRVAWPQSQIREQTLKTVARWMEEDRISGRVVLGGGSKASSIFGWNDPKAPAVPLASVFGTKQGRKTTSVTSSVETDPEVPREWPKGLVRDRSASKSRSPSKARRRSAAKSASISESPKASHETAAANFGWNSSPTAREQLPIPLPNDAVKAVPTTMKQSSPLGQLSSSNSRLIVANVSKSTEMTRPKKPEDVKGLHILPASTPTMSVLPPTFASTSNEDDDFGEMVASPVAPTTPVLLPSPNLRHKKSQSLNSAFSPPGQSSLINSSISLLPTQSHKPGSIRTSLDLESNTTNAFTTSPTIFPIPFVQAASSVALATSNNDPWASADFSFFDSPVPAPAAATKSVPAPVSKPMSKAVSFSKVPPAPSPLRHGKTRMEIEQDEIIASIVQNLPNLSYMLRR